MSGISCNTVCTLGSVLLNVQLRNRSIQQIFHIVPDDLFKKKYDAICGQDFLNAGEITISFKYGKMYTDSFCTQISCDCKQNSILKNKKNKETKEKKKPIIDVSTKSTSKRSTNTPIAVTNYYACLPIQDDEMQYESDYATNAFVNTHFSPEIMNVIRKENSKILFGCKDQKLFCNANKNNVSYPSKRLPKTKPKVETKNKQKANHKTEEIVSNDLSDIYGRQQQFSASVFSDEIESENAVKEDENNKCIFSFNTVLGKKSYTKEYVKSIRVCFGTP